MSASITSNCRAVTSPARRSSTRRRSDGGSPTTDRSYAAFDGAGLDGGLAAPDTVSSPAPLVILKTDDLEDALVRVEAAGARSPHAIFDSRAGGASSSTTLPATARVWAE